MSAAGMSTVGMSVTLGTTTSAVAIDDVSVRFQSKRTEVTAIGQVSLDVAPGEFVSIVGPSGCGKSTLLKLVSGLLKPSSGSVTLLGEEVRNRAQVGSGDLCLITRWPLDQVMAQLASQGVEILEGPVTKSGACGPIESVYCLDPDRNLIEISRYR